MRKIFVTGIGTGVGKTVASAVLAEALEADYWKPVQCGLEPMTDAELVRSLLSNKRSVVHPEVYRFKDAMSPNAAAELARVEIDLDNIKIPTGSSNRTLIIEGAGGLLVPLNGRELMADLISKLDAEVIVVADFYLGSINHTLLTCSELKRRQLPVLGLLFLGTVNEASASIILKNCGLKLLGRIAHEKKVDKNTVSKWAAQMNSFKKEIVIGNG